MDHECRNGSNPDATQFWRSLAKCSEIGSQESPRLVDPYTWLVAQKKCMGRGGVIDLAGNLAEVVGQLRQQRPQLSGVAGEDVLPDRRPGRRGAWCHAARRPSPPPRSSWMNSCV